MSGPTTAAGVARESLKSRPRPSPHAVNEIFDALLERAEEQRWVSVGDVVESIGHRGYGPFLVLPALLELSPLGGIPGVPTFLALLIGIAAIQVALGRSHLWLPPALECRRVPADKLELALRKMRPMARWLDRWFHKRMAWMTSTVMVRAAAMLVVLLCLTVPPLEVVPFASSAPMMAIVMFGLAMTVRDGALMLGGLLVVIVGAATGAAVAL